jgi:hypothetical protein
MKADDEGRGFSAPICSHQRRPRQESLSVGFKVSTGPMTPRYTSSKQLDLDVYSQHLIPHDGLATWEGGRRDDLEEKENVQAAGGRSGEWA